MPASTISAERRRRHRRQHLGGVAQQRTDVQGPVRVRNADQRGRGGGRIGQVFTPGPDPVAVPHRRRVVVRALTKQLLKRLGHEIVAGRISP